MSSVNKNNSNTTVCSEFLAFLKPFSMNCDSRMLSITNIHTKYKYFAWINEYIKLLVLLCVHMNQFIRDWGSECALVLTLHSHHQNESAFRWEAVWVMLMFHSLWGTVTIYWGGFSSGWPGCVRHCMMTDWGGFGSGWPGRVWSYMMTDCLSCFWWWSTRTCVMLHDDRLCIITHRMCVCAFMLHALNFDNMHL